MIYLYEHSIYTWFICFTECIHISWQWNVFYMYQANDKTIIRHAKNLNMFKEQLSYLEEAEKIRSEVRIIQPTGRWLQSHDRTRHRYSSLI